MRSSGSPKKPLSVFAVMTLLSVLVMPLTSSAKTIVYKDIEGVWHRIDSTEWPKGRAAFRRQIRARVSFDVTFTDEVLNNNKGFDAPGGVGAQRQAAAVRAIQYIADKLNEPGSCDIEFEVSQTDGGGFLASAGPLFFADPGFFSGFCFDHITTGTDQCDAACGGGTDPPDIQATVDFGFPWNNGPAAPAQNQYDLESVLLHELTHGLGMVGLAEANGNPSAQLPGVYTVFENFLFTGNGKDLFVPGSPNPRFNGVPSDLTGGGGGVFFRGPHATSSFGGNHPEVFAPSPYQEGSSISHWNTPDFPNPPKPVMIHQIVNGESRRSFVPFELAALQDLGYTVVGAPATSTPTRTATRTPTGPTPTPGPMPSQSEGGSVMLVLVMLLAAAGTLVSATRRRLTDGHPRR